MNNTKTTAEQTIRYEAIGREAGVITWRCGHRHKTEEAAQRCGDKQWNDECGHVASCWWDGGVVEVD